MTTSSSKFSRDAILLIGARSTAQIVMVLVQAVLARQLGVADFGKFISAFAIATVLAGLTDFGASTLWIREYAAGRLTAHEFGCRSAGRILYVVAIVVLLFALGTLQPAFQILKPTSAMLLSMVVSRIAQTMLLAARTNMKLSMIVLSERILLAGGFIALMLFTPLQAHRSFVYSYFIASIFIGCLTTVLVPQLRPNFGEAALRRTWQGAKYYGISSSLIALQSTDVLIGGAVGGPIVAGSYGAVSKWIIPVTLSTQAFTSLLHPVVAAATDRHDVWLRIRRTLWIPVTSLAISGALIAFAPLIVLNVLGPEFEASAPVLQLMAVSAALSALAQVAFTVLQARRREKVVAIAIVFSVGLHLLSIPILVPMLGVRGLGVAAIAGQALLCVILARALLKILRRKKR